MKREVAIAFKNVTKSYNPNLGLKSILRTYFNLENPTRAIPVLNEVTFNIYKGDFFFILGDNGAGKSTLLKMISGVLKPTSGSIEIHGKVDAIHELTAGFNYELNGYDNLKLLATIKNIQDNELKENLDNIIAFSELSDHDLKKPLKYYSTGMKTRLAYAMNISFVKDILLLDEVLAVGDLKFKYKCIEKIKELQETGVTVVIVTHDTRQLKNLLTNGVLISKDKVSYFENFMSYELSIASHKIHQITYSKHLKDVTITVAESDNEILIDINKHPENYILEIDDNFSNLINLNLQFSSALSLNELQLISILKDIRSDIRIMDNIVTDLKISKGSNNIAVGLNIPMISRGDYSMEIYLFQKQHESLDYIMTFKFILKSNFKTTYTLFKNPFLINFENHI